MPTLGIREREEHAASRSYEGAQCTAQLYLILPLISVDIYCFCRSQGTQIWNVVDICARRK